MAAAGIQAGRVSPFAPAWSLFLEGRLMDGIQRATATAAAHWLGLLTGDWSRVDWHTLREPDEDGLLRLTRARFAELVLAASGTMAGREPLRLVARVTGDFTPAIRGHFLQHAPAGWLDGDGRMAAGFALRYDVRAARLTA